MNHSVWGHSPVSPQVSSSKAHRTIAKRYVTEFLFDPCELWFPYRLHRSNDTSVTYLLVRDLWTTESGVTPQSHLGGHSPLHPSAEFHHFFFGGGTWSTLVWVHYLAPPAPFSLVSTFCRLDITGKRQHHRYRQVYESHPYGDGHIHQLHIILSVMFD